MAVRASRLDRWPFQRVRDARSEARAAESPPRGDLPDDASTIWLSVVGPNWLRSVCRLVLTLTLTALVSIASACGGQGSTGDPEVDCGAWLDALDSGSREPDPSLVETAPQLHPWETAVEANRVDRRMRDSGRASTVVNGDGSVSPLALASSTTASVTLTRSARRTSRRRSARSTTYRRSESTEIGDQEPQRVASPFVGTQVREGPGGACPVSVDTNGLGCPRCLYCIRLLLF
jgi:hypothetical protein